jgi:hypothetical protein
VDKEKLKSELSKLNIPVKNGKIRKKDVVAALQTITAGPVNNAFSEAFKLAAQDIKEWEQIRGKEYGINMAKSAADMYAKLDPNDLKDAKILGSIDEFLLGFIEGLKMTLQKHR